MASKGALPFIIKSEGGTTTMCMHLPDLVSLRGYVTGRTADRRSPGTHEPTTLQMQPPRPVKEGGGGERTWTRRPTYQDFVSLIHALTRVIS